MAESAQNKIVCSCCESEVENAGKIYQCSDCDWESCGLCLVFHQQIANHYGNSPSSDTETSGYLFHGISRGIV